MATIADKNKKSKYLDLYYSAYYRIHLESFTNPEVSLLALHIYGEFCMRINQGTPSANVISLGTKYSIHKKFHINKRNVEKYIELLKTSGVIQELTDNTTGDDENKAGEENKSVEEKKEVEGGNIKGKEIVAIFNPNIYHGFICRVDGMKKAEKSQNEIDEFIKAFESGNSKLLSDKYSFPDMSFYNCGTPSDYIPKASPVDYSDQLGAFEHNYSNIRMDVAQLGANEPINSNIRMDDDKLGAFRPIHSNFKIDSTQLGAFEPNHADIKTDDDELGAFEHIHSNIETDVCDLHLVEKEKVHDEFKNILLSLSNTAKNGISSPELAEWLHYIAVFAQNNGICNDLYTHMGEGGSVHMHLVDPKNTPQLGAIAPRVGAYAPSDLLKRPPASSFRTPNYINNKKKENNSDEVAARGTVNVKKQEDGKMEDYGVSSSLNKKEEGLGFRYEELKEKEEREDKDRLTGNWFYSDEEQDDIHSSSEEVDIDRSLPCYESKEEEEIRHKLESDMEQYELELSSLIENGKEMYSQGAKIGYDLWMNYKPFSDEEKIAHAKKIEEVNKILDSIEITQDWKDYAKEELDKSDPFYRDIVPFNAMHEECIEIIEKQGAIPLDEITEIYYFYMKLFGHTDNFAECGSEVDLQFSMLHPRKSIKFFFKQSLIECKAKDGVYTSDKGERILVTDKEGKPYSGTCYRFYVKESPGGGIYTSETQEDGTEALVKVDMTNPNEKLENSNSPSKFDVEAVYEELEVKLDKFKWPALRFKSTSSLMDADTILPPILKALGIHSGDYIEYNWGAALLNFIREHYGLDPVSDSSSDNGIGYDRPFLFMTPFGHERKDWEWWKICDPMENPYYREEKERIKAAR